MAFVDVNPYANVSVTAAGGAPTGGGTYVGQYPGDNAIGTPPGMHGPGGSGAVHHWIIGFYLIIAVVLISTGVLFNGKGRAV
jgi:hypothetical protein